MAKRTTKDEIAEIWQLFREVAAQIKENDAKLTQQFRETDILLKEQFRETDARLDKRFQETDANISRLEGMFTSQWGRMIEALVHPNALKLFQERKIQVRYVYRRSKSQMNGKTLEVDLLLEDEDEVVVVEAKSKLGVSDVQDALEDLDAFPHFFPKYPKYHIYGAVAGLNIEENADRYAYKRGLFVLGVTGDGLVQIKNDASFRPRDFGPGSEATNGI